MKLALLSEHLTGQGSEYVTAMTARMFAARGWEVDVLVSQVHADYLKEGRKAFDLPPNAKLVYMPSRRGSRNGWFVRKYLKHGGADLVICESGIYATCVAVAALGISRSRLPKLAQTVHGNFSILSGWKLFKARLRYWFIYRKFFAMMTVNQRSADNFRAQFGFIRHLRVACVNNACVDEVFWRKIKLGPMHPWLQKKECDWKTIVTAGACEPCKDHLTLIRAMAMVRDAGRKVRLVIFGRGKLLDAYRKEIRALDLEDRVSVGQYSDRLPAEMKASDGFVLSSNGESFGIVLVEALASGVQCIATDANYGPREILADGKYGRLVPISDPVAMAAAIIDLDDGKIAPAPDESWRRYQLDRIEQRYYEVLGLTKSGGLEG